MPAVKPMLTEAFYMTVITDATKLAPYHPCQITAIHWKFSMGVEERRNSIANVYAQSMKDVFAL